MSGRGAGMARILIVEDEVLVGMALERERRVEIDRVLIELQLTGLGFGVVEDLVDEFEQVLAGLPDVRGEILVLRGPDRTFGLVGDEVREPDDGVQRGAQFVGQVGQELALGAVGVLSHSRSSGVARRRPSVSHFINIPD